jgi:NADH-quinone oxidoreductase subunit L
VTEPSFALYLIPLLPLLGALVNLTLGRKLRRETVELVAVFAVGAACLLAILAVTGPLWDLWHGGAAAPQLRDRVYTWLEAGTFRVELSFLLDPLSAVMVLVITFVGLLIHIYSMGYMAHDPRYAAYFGYLNLFTGAMLILVLGDSLPVMFIGWEGVGLCSYLLIGFWFDKEKNASAGKKAFLVNRVGDFGFLLGIFLLFLTTKSVDFAGLQGAMPRLLAPLAPGGGLPLAFWAGLLLFVGACGKSAQIPLYVWLPDAMAGPTPVSALIHAATMVTAGVYMVARLGFLFLAGPQVLMVVAGVGALTALFAAIIGFAQTDIKKVLAYSTVSQLGFMFVGVGTGAFGAGVFHLVTHAFFKAGLFLGAGSIMHAMGDRTDIMGMGGLRKKTPLTHATFLTYCLAIAGIVPFAGFFSKDEILLRAYTAELPGWPVWYGKALWTILSVAALGTAFYMWRLYFLVFGGESRADAETQAHIHESPLSMTLPLVVLAVGATLLGVLGLPHLEIVPHALTDLFGTWLNGTFVAAGSVALAPHPSAGLTVGLMLFALLGGVVGIGFAALLYRNGPSEAVGRLSTALGPLHRLVASKFYIDELYERVLLRPFRGSCELIYRVVDRFVIDLVLVNGTAFVVDVFGRIARWWQNGDVQRYLAVLVVGVAALLWLTTWSSARIEVSQEEGGYKFVADVGAGPAVKNAVIKWDFDGDRRPDAAGREASWTFVAPGPHHVTLWVEDAFGYVTRVERTLAVEAVEP